MTAPALDIDEGWLPTARLELYHLRVRRPGAPRVLLLGGSNFDLRLKRGFLDTQIAQCCDIATFEPRGIGRTQQPGGPWTMRDYALDALAFLDALGWPEAIVLGESFGGMTALHMSVLAAHRLRAMIVASATAGGVHHASYDISRFLDLTREDAARAALCLQDTRLAAVRDQSPEDFAAHLATRLAFEAAFADPSISSGGYARLLDARRGHDCAGILDQIKTATTVIAGRYNNQAPATHQSALAKGLPKASFHLFDAGHGVLFADPRASDTALSAIRKAADVATLKPGVL